MCTMRVVILREMLGNRETGWTLWDGKQVMEMTSKQIKDTIAKGSKVCGLTIGSDGELERDELGFACSNIMEHRHCGNYSPMEDGGMANLFYICIGSHEENGEMVYDCISTRFEQLKLAEAEMRAYLKIGVVNAGVKEVDGKLVVADLEFKKPETVEPKELPKEAEKAVVAEFSKETETPEAKPEEKKPDVVEPKVAEEPKKVTEEPKVTTKLEEAKPVAKAVEKAEAKPVAKEEPKPTVKAEEKPLAKEEKKAEPAKAASKVETKPVAKPAAGSKK